MSKLNKQKFMENEKVEEVAETTSAPEKVIKVSPFETKVILSDGTELFIKKLKAGKYFEAQKAFTTWVSVLQNSVSEKIDKSADGKVDEESVREALVNGTITIADFTSKIMEAEEHRTKLLSVALDMTEEAVLENIYPEDLNILLGVVVDLNNFMQNIKNSAAPIAGLGA